MAFFTVLAPLVGYSAEQAVDNQDSNPNRLFNPFYPNYVLIGADSLTSELDREAEDINADIKFQLSFVTQFNTGLAEVVPLDMGSKFVDINYRPEFFFRLPYFSEFDFYYGYIHESNGRDGEESGGWDRAFFRVNWDFGEPISRANDTSLKNKWNLDVRGWKILPGTTSNRNRDIRKFAGNFEATINVSKINNRWLCFSRKKCGYGLVLRKGGGIDDFSHGLVQLDTRFPITQTGVQLVLQLTSGYGHSIERYNVHETAARVLLQFSDIYTPGR